MEEQPEARHLPSETLAHYGTGYEQERLWRGMSRLELARSQELLRRYLPPPPAVIMDIGGGPGMYAVWLASAGYQVHLLDAVPLHVEQAKEASSRQRHPFSAVVGDARELPYADDSADAVVLFGPLYHLTERDDRLRALTAVRRILRPGGVVLAAAISRFASLSDGLKHGFLEDPAFAQIVARDLDEGQHRNPGNHPHFFTTAFFHHPQELEQEITDAGLALEALVAVEGPAMLIPDLDDWWQDEARREQLLSLIARVEREPSLLGVSPHLMAIGRSRD